MKIQFKIALLFASLTGGILLAMGVSLYYLINQNTFEDFYKRLEIRAIVAARSSLDSVDVRGQAYSDISREHLEPLDQQKQVIVEVSKQSEIPRIAEELAVPSEVVQRAIGQGQSTWRNSQNIFFNLLRHEHAGKSYLVVVSAKNTQSTEYLKNLRQALTISFVVAALLAFLVGLFFSKSILKPIRNMTSRVRHMGASDLHLRLDTPSSKDEIGELTNTFNNLLDRLETAFESQNNFVSHASHEFNTPLTSIIGEADYALSREREPQQYRASIQAIQGAAERLSGITRSLLQLAQTGMTDKAQEMGPVRLDELIQKARKMTMDIIPGSQVQINDSLAPGDLHRLVVNGNQTLLELAVTNILLNACKYSSNKPVQLAIAATRDKAMLLIRDEGIGIPSDELKYIYDPFFRARNTDTYKGYGIGLPLTRNIIRLHNGEMIVNSVEGFGTEVQLILPLG